MPEIVVCDNLKSGATKTCRYEPELNSTYQDLAIHYGLAVVPARVRKPRDRAKAEAGVQFVERWILARLRDRTFFSLDELNEAMGELLDELNDRPFQNMEGSRRSHFEAVDRPALSFTGMARALRDQLDDRPARRLRPKATRMTVPLFSRASRSTSSAV